MDKSDLIRKIESMKGLSSGAGAVFGRVLDFVKEDVRTMEAGDINRNGQVSAAPVATDLWYLWHHQNMLQKYYEDVEGEDVIHKDYSTYLSGKMSFLPTGLKPLKTFPDMENQLSIHQGDVSLFGNEVITPSVYDNNGVYWVNTAFFELRHKDMGLEYPSDGSPGAKDKPNEYVGYLAFPVGQLGVMEVISLFTETDFRGYPFTAATNLYHAKTPPTLESKDLPSVQSPPDVFPDMKNESGNQLAGMNYCFGRHLIEYAYYKPETPMPQQNTLNADGATAYSPEAARDVELWASDIKDYGEDIKPKKWMRYWIHKDSTLPVPGEFVGILVRPVACPPHVWWFQESAPLLYAGNWMETRNLTSGIVTSVTLEAARTDGGTGNLYGVSIQGVNVNVSASDYLTYAVGDRVGILKTDSATKAEKAFSSLQQTHLKTLNEGTTITNYVIVPITYYKIKH